VRTLYTSQLIRGFRGGRGESVCLWEYNVSVLVRSGGSAACWFGGCMDCMLLFLVGKNY